MGLVVSVDVLSASDVTLQGVAEEARWSFWGKSLEVPH